MRTISIFFLLSILLGCNNPDKAPRNVRLFTENWKFFQGDEPDAFKPDFDDSSWRILDLPHDWSIEGNFSPDHPSGTQGGSLPTGIGWYRKTFRLPVRDAEKHYFIDFDGIYRNSEVWINGHYLGKRPSGYSSFRYDLTPWLHYGEEENVLSVRVDNSLQPNSRWYTGSGIYRKVWLVRTGTIHVDHWGSFARTPIITGDSALVELELDIRNHTKQEADISVWTDIFNPDGQLVASARDNIKLKDSITSLMQEFIIEDPELWTLDSPDMYRALTHIFHERKITDRYETSFGIRFFRFDADSGFFLNGKPIKIHGVNQHHDLGALGAAVNVRAMERQLGILRDMGCNAIRTAHNLPAPELLDLTDRMGFLVMDECFDVWARRKLRNDAHLDWEEWHKRDLEDMVRRDRNHPSVIMWSIGNEIPEQFDSTGTRIARELTHALKALDDTRPVTCALTEQDPGLNYIYRSGVLDVIAFNYKHKEYPDFPMNFPGEKLLAAENMSAFATRGHYDMPSDSIRIWPAAYGEPLVGANPDFTVSAYDHVHAYWGATHEETWNIIRNHDFIAGMFIWSGFDYLGEPTPYPWPARSSYFGVIDLAGFPKDTYHLYRSEWTDQNVLHLFPHWNWEKGKIIDVWAYYNNADEAELFLNGESAGVRSKREGEFHVMWRLAYEPGTIRAVTRKDGRIIMEKEIRTADEPAAIELVPDREKILADGRDLCFITVRVLDKNGNLCPRATNLIEFRVSGSGRIAGVDNGYQASLESFKADHRKAFNGMCLLIVQAANKKGKIEIEALSEDLASARINVRVR
jgi:beta-galactosidase